jgi:hypothetical protein
MTTTGPAQPPTDKGNSNNHTPRKPDRDFTIRLHVIGLDRMRPATLHPQVIVATSQSPSG